MEKKDVLRLKSGLKLETCNISKVAGCFVNAAKEKIVTYTDDFQDLTEEGILRYLDIAKRILSSNLGNYLMEVAITEGCKDIQSKTNDNVSRNSKNATRS